MKIVVRRSSQVLASVLLFLALSSVFYGVGSVWAVDGSETLSMSAVEDVSILGSGVALVTLLVNVADSPLADMYRELLAAPSDAGVGEEMPIPENVTEKGGVAPVRQEYYRSIKQEQMISFGFGMRILNSSMVPRDEQNGCKVSIDAVASPQVVSVTDVGSDVIFEVVVGPKDENATGAAFGHLLTKVAFAQQMLESVEGEQVYELEWTTRINVPAEAELLNGDELDGLSWVVSFGGGTSMNAFVNLDGPSTIVLSERTVITEQNVTATPAEIFEAFSGYKVFTIRYQLPESALAEGEGLWASAIDRDFSFSWDWSLSLDIPIPFVYTYGPGKIEGTLTVTPTFSFSGYIGWDFDWVPWPELDWFKAWIGVGVSLRVRLDATVTLGIEHTWERTLFDTLLYRFTFSIGPVPVWADLDFSIIARFTVGAEATVDFWVEVLAGASLKAGVKYDSGWSPIWESNLYGYLVDGPGIGDMTISAWADASLMARLSLLIYSLAGPFIEFGPYIRGTITYLVDEEVAPWSIVTGVRLNVGITFAGFIKDLLDLNDYTYNIGDWPIKTWEGHWGQARSSISINLEPTSTYIGSATMVSGEISSPYEGNKGGTVHIEYRARDDDDWVPVPGGSVRSRASGEYSFFWVLQEAGDFYVRSWWDGNIGYKGAESGSVSLTVSSVVSGPQYIPPYYQELDELFMGFYASTMLDAAAVRFTPPTPLWKLDTFRVYASIWNTMYLIPDYDWVRMEVWDINLNTLWAGEFLMTDCFPEEGYVGGWKEVDIEPDILVSDDFYIVVYCEAWSGYRAYIKIGRDGKLPLSGHGARVKVWPDHTILYSGGDDWGMLASGYSLVEEHYMYAKRFVPVYIPGIGYVWMLRDVETNTFYIAETYAYSLVKFRSIHPWNCILWKWYDPDGNLYQTSYQIVEDTALPITAVDSAPIEDNRALYEQYLGRPFEVEIYLAEAYVKGIIWPSGEIWWGFRDLHLAVTETFIVIKYESSISIALSSDSITYGQSVQISSQISPSFSDGTTTLQYSVDDIHWDDIAADTPSDGYYSQTWLPPHAGTYYIRAVWSGNPNYAAATSETVTLTVDQAPTSITTSLSSTTIFVGSTVTITTTLTSTITGAPLQGKDVTIQFSSDGSTWYTLSPETTDSAGVCTYEWTPDLGVYYIRSMWYGDDDYFGANSPSIQLTVEPSIPTMIEIVNGADAEIDRTPDATAEFAVRVIDQLTGLPLENIGRVEFYVSDQSYYNNILVGSDTDEDADGIYRIEWNTGDWPVLGPQHWSAYFKGTLEYMPSSASSTFTIYYYGVALWIDPTFQEVSISSTETLTINFRWNRDTQDTFDLSLTGLDPSWYTLSQTSITVSTRGQTEQITLTISPPSAPTILKDYEFTVTATSQADPSFSVTATATVRVDFTPTLPATPTGGLATAVQPKTIYMSAGTTIVINILIINNQNFDDTVTVDLTNRGIPTQYQANLAWFDWTTAKVFLPAGGSIYIPLEITVPAETPTNMYVFRAVATSTADLAIAATDAGIIRLQ